MPFQTQAGDPDQIEITLNITATVADWRDVCSRLDTHWLAEVISEKVKQVVCAYDASDYAP